MIKLNEKGFPEIDLAIFAPTKSGQGNDFHNPATGRFTYAPPGVTVTTGEELLKNVSATTRRLIFQRAKTGLANQMAARIIDGRLHVVLLRNGKRIDSFAIDPKSARNKTGDESSEQVINPSQMEGPIRDALLDAARILDLQGDKLFKFLEGRLGRKLEQNEKQQLEIQVKAFRVNDLVDYLHSQLQAKENNTTPTNSIRVAVPRGFVRKSFAGLSKEEANEVFKRLESRGWSEDILQNRIASGLPANIRKDIYVKTKAEKGKKKQKAKK